MFSSLYNIQHLYSILFLFNDKGKKVSLSFAHYSMYRAVKEQHQYLIEQTGIRQIEDTE